jgi:hypothetical protein
MPRRNDTKAAEVFAHELAANPLVFQCLSLAMRSLAAAGRCKSNEIITVVVEPFTGHRLGCLLSVHRCILVADKLVPKNGDINRGVDAKSDAIAFHCHYRDPDVVADHQPLADLSAQNQHGRPP